MRVKLFWKSGPLKGRGVFGALATAGDNALDLESQINALLSENRGVKIVDIKQSSSGGSFEDSLWFVSVWYEEGGV